MTEQDLTIERGLTDLDAEDLDLVAGGEGGGTYGSGHRDGGGVAGSGH